MSSEDFFAEMKILKSHIGFGMFPVQHHSKVNLKIASKSFKKIAKCATREFAQSSFDLNEIVFCGLSLLQATFLQSTMDPLNPKHPGFKIRQQFCAILKLLIPEKTPEVIDVVLNYLRDGVLFKSQEFLTMECLHCLSLSDASCDLILEKIINFIEEMIIANRIDEATNACRALYLSVADNFKKLSSSGLTRLLTLYHLSVEKNESNNKLSLFRTSFEITAKKIFKIMDVDQLLLFAPKSLVLTFENEMSSRIALIDFGLTIQEVFIRLSSSNIEENLKPEILEYLFKALTLKCEIKSFLACRFLIVFLDHLNNLKHFSTPKIFYEGSTHKVRVSKNTHEALVEANHELIESSIMTTIKLHGFKKKNLNAIYALICVMLTTMPSAAMHIMTIDILMELQAYMIDGRQSAFNSINKNQIHAFIISLMTLICWMTRAKALSRYVREVVNARHNHAPHLLPPLRDSYEHESHHVFGYKPELYFDKWEMRYCLWRLYRIEKLCLNRNEFEKKRREKKMSFFKFNVFSRKIKKSN